MRKLSALFLAIIFVIASSIAVYSQEQNQRQADDKGVIEIEAQRLDVRMELPQVQILDKRKSSQFNEVKVEKSFQSELSGKTEELKFKPNTTQKVPHIQDIAVLLKKRRF